MVGILDSTLREGEQTPGVAFTVQQRIEIAKALSDAGVAMIEAGHPTVSPDIREGIKGIVKLKREGVIESEIIGHSRAVEKDIEEAASLEVDRVAIFYGISDIHLKSKHKTDRDSALQLIEHAVRFARSHGVKVRFTAEDASRADPGYLIRVVKTARNAGADRVSIADTVGVLKPTTTRDFFSWIRREVPDVELDIHAHNDMGNAVANSLAAVEGGATIVHATVNGLGERVGITPLQVIGVALKYHLGVDVVKLEKLTQLSSLVEKYSGIPLPPNYPITGDYAFVHKAGVHVAGILSDPKTYEFIPPEVLGRSRDYTIDKYSGRNGIRRKLERMGVTLSDDVLDKVLSKIKEKEDAKFYRDEDLLELVEEVTGSKLRPRPPEEIEAVISVKCEPNVYTTSVTRRLHLVDGVKEVMEVSGEYDIIVKITAKDTTSLNQIIEQVRGVKGIKNTTTALVLKKM
ncbi:2-isopropylmalate synthase [Sulfodiicoccus acidiphilus]|uniref:Homocitrate synthase n=1 Tax=Sulfodiicoccus acidiphilus TaxID=1670455 RepID=A0A348B0F7_9CREN|nr:homocitrate synthase [Sulfodiicoccus acidiphilus]BBD71659.1 2-isopropylmalate synthase [Sulfodiicoccus acidiphilus]GGT86794.1 2-isopropylmalate synthase [Sulfodiicoccus acidiphilus]